MARTDVLNFALADEAQNLSFGQRVLWVLKQQKRSKSWLAEEIGVSKQGLGYILARSSLKLLNEISMALEVNPIWLETGKGSFALNNTFSRDDVSYLPLITMQEISFFMSGAESKNLDKVVASPNLPSNCFATTLDTSTMEPLFRQGSILIFDPEKTPRTRDYVIFTIGSSNETFFRQYFCEGKNVYLKAIDTMYQTITDDQIKIHGVLVESRNCFS